MLIKFLDGTSREIAYLRGADLRDADLRGANLRDADLRDADLRDADLRGADLRGAYLRGANLQSANLQSADLRDADLRGADLRGADLRGADLRGASLRGTDLRGTDLRGADLQSANLQSAKGLEQQVIAFEGMLIGYKKLANSKIAILRIPAKAKRVNAYGSRKCRAEYAMVISGDGVDKHSGTTKYAKGKRVTPDKYDPDPRVECSHGIHFFLTKQEAKDY